MTTTEHGSTWVIDVSDDTFEKEVIERSKEIPVIVDFWAEWCGPCRILGPTLEKLAEEGGGKFLLAKVDTERCPRLSQAFGIRSIPSVIAFRNGKAVEGFAGALPEDGVRAFLRKLVPSETDEIVARADGLASSDSEAAERLYREVLEKDPRHEGAGIGLAELLAAKGEADEAKEIVDGLMPATGEHAGRIEHLHAELTLREKLKDVDEDAIRKRLEENPEDAEALLELGQLLAAKRRFEEALDSLLRAAEADRSLAGERVKPLMVDIFHIIGVRSELADDYRAKLARLLY